MEGLNVDGVRIAQSVDAHRAAAHVEARRVGEPGDDACGADGMVLLDEPRERRPDAPVSLDVEVSLGDVLGVRPFDGAVDDGPE